MIDAPARLPELQADHAGPVALVPVRQAYDLAPQFNIAILPTLVVHAGTDPGNPQGALHTIAYDCVRLRTIAYDFKVCGVC